MGNLHDRMPTRGIQNPVPTKVELWAFNSSRNILEKVTMDALGHFGTCDVDKASATLFYEGLEDANENWQIVKTVISGTVTSNRFATILNNPSYSSYTDAWTNRA